MAINMSVAMVVGFLRGFAELIAGALTPWRVTVSLAVCALYAALWAVDRPPRVAR